MSSSSVGGNCHLDPCSAAFSPLSRDERCGRRVRAPKRGALQVESKREQLLGLGSVHHFRTGADSSYNPKDRLDTSFSTSQLFLDYRTTAARVRFPLNASLQDPRRTLPHRCLPLPRLSGEFEMYPPLLRYSSEPLVRRKKLSDSPYPTSDSCWTSVDLSTPSTSSTTTFRFASLSSLPPSTPSRPSSTPTRHSSSPSCPMPLTTLRRPASKPSSFQAEEGLGTHLPS